MGKGVEQEAVIVGGDRSREVESAEGLVDRGGAGRGKHGRDEVAEYLGWDFAYQLVRCAGKVSARKCLVHGGTALLIQQLRSLRELAQTGQEVMPDREPGL